MRTTKTNKEMSGRGVKYLIIICLIALGSASYGATRTSVQSGDWNDASTWNCNCTPANNDNVIIASGTIVSLTKHIKVKHLTIQNSATLDVTTGNYRIIVKKNWKNDGLFLAHKGKVVFRGNHNQVISGTSPSLFYKVKLRKNNGAVKALAPLFVEKRLYLKKGILETDDINYVTIGVNGKSVQASDASYIEGPVQIETDDIKMIVFNTGKDGKHKKMAIDVESNDPSAFLVKYAPNSVSNTTCGPGLSHLTSSDAWTVDQVNGTASGEVELFWDASDGSTSPVHSMANAKVAQYCHYNAFWLDAGNTGTTGSTTVGSMYSNEMHSFGAFTFACSDENCPEHNGSNKMGEPIVNGGEEAIDEEENSQEEQEQEFMMPRHMNVFPNPAEGELVNISLHGHDEDEVLVVVVDMLGNEHYSKVAIKENGQHVVAIDLKNDLAPGIYMVIGSSQDNVYKKQLMIQ